MEPVPLRLPTIKAPIYLRAGTSDSKTFDQVFIAEHQAVYLENEPKVIFDVGANIGLASILFANRYPQAQIIAVEPERSNYELLCRNVAPYPNIKTIECGVWYRDSWLTISNPDDEKWAMQVIESTESSDDRIQGFSLLTLMERFSVSTIDLLKVDIEGAEVELFGDGFEDWIDCVGVLMVELHDRIRPGCEAAFAAATHRAWEVFQHGEYTVAKLPTSQSSVGNGA